MEGAGGIIHSLVTGGTMPGGSMPEPRPLEVYLNDHLAGATGACEVARNAAEKYATTPHRDFLGRFLIEVEEDRATLEELIRTAGGTPNPLKQAGAWIMEKVSRLKLSPGGTGSEEMSVLLTLETLCIGVEGKLCLWRALKELSGQTGALGTIDFDQLIRRAQAQRDGLERERLAAARTALPDPVGASR
jgi:hypothetical protein